MNCTQQDQNNQKPTPPSKRFLADRTWAHQHLSEIAKLYPNQWVAIADKQIIAAGTNGAEVKRMATEKSGREDYVIIFAEKGLHVYQNQPQL